MANGPGMPVVLTIEGMACDGCAEAVTRTLVREPGVTGVAVDRAGGRAEIAGTAAPARLVAALAAAGFTAR